MWDLRWSIGTWAVITASAVGRTVTHVNAHRGSKAAIFAPEKLLFRLALLEKCLPRDKEEKREEEEGEEEEEEEEKEEEIPREFIPAISARRARRFDARTDIFPQSGSGGNAIDPRGEESYSRVKKQDVTSSAETFF
ncbi:hypothetical protein P5V15_007962 [Pogonomyrmex californicus]